MSSIVIGKANGKNIHLDVDALLRGRMLIEGNSGAGKSWAIRLVAERLFGKIQVILVDSEGEFATLREKYGYVLVGKGGETPADPRSAALVAHKLLELRASAVCDLYEMKSTARHEWVQKFLEAMIDAPKNLWHPCVVIVDEAHIFCPEKGAGESVAAEAVIGMATRGRKRGFALVLATQRLGKLRKDAAAELLNLLIGKTFIDIDRKRAADALGVYGTDQRAFFDEIKMLKRGLFYGLGPAISEERVLIEVGSVETTHPEAGSSKHAAEPPPAPEAIAKLLPKLSDLPKAAEEKAKTEADLRSEIRSLKAQLRTQPTGSVEKQFADALVVKKAVEGTSRKYQKHIGELHRTIGRLQGALISLAEAATKGSKIEPPKMEPSAVYKAEVSFVNSKGTEVTPPTRGWTMVKPESNGDLNGPQRKILKALAELKSIGKEVAPRAMVAAWAGYSPEGGAFGNPIGALNSGGYVVYPQPGFVSLTEHGESIIGTVDAPDAQEIRRRIKSICSGPERKIISVLMDLGLEEITKDELAARSGYSPVGGAFGNPLGALRTKGLLDYPRPGVVKASEWIFSAD